MAASNSPTALFHRRLWPLRGRPRCQRPNARRTPSELTAADFSAAERSTNDREYYRSSSITTASVGPSASTVATD